MKHFLQFLAAVAVSLAFGAGMSLAARNASGTYSSTSGVPVTTGTAISSTVFNNLTADYATEITDSLSRSGKGPMLAPLELISTGGTVGTPAISFDSDENTGLYRVAADVLGITAAGTSSATFTDEGAQLPLGLTIGGGTHISHSFAACGALDFAGTTDTCETLTITVTGALVNDACFPGPPAALPHANSWISCWVSASNVVSVKHCSHGASGNPASGTYCARVFRAP